MVKHSEEEETVSLWPLDAIGFSSTRLDCALVDGRERIFPRVFSFGSYELGGMCWMYVCMCKCMYVCVYVFMYVCMYVCMCVCVCMRVCLYVIYIHTYVCM